MKIPVPSVAGVFIQLETLHIHSKKGGFYRQTKQYLETCLEGSPYLSCLLDLPTVGWERLSGEAGEAGQQQQQAGKVSPHPVEIKLLPPQSRYEHVSVSNKEKIRNC